MSRAFSDSLAWHAAGIERIGDGYDTERPPDRQTRQAMTLRHDELTAALDWRARDRQANKVAIAAMMLAYRSTGRCTEGEASNITKLYAKVVEDRPAWAVRRACEQIMRGEAAGVSLDFPPAAPRLREVVNGLLEPLFAEAHQLRCVLTAHPRKQISKEERELVQRRFAELLEDLRAQKACDLGTEADVAYAEHLAEIDAAAQRENA